MQIEKMEKKVSKLEEAKKSLETELMNATQRVGRMLGLNQELENMKTALELAEELRTDLDADAELFDERASHC